MQSQPSWMVSWSWSIISGRSVFADMMQWRHPARYFAFDLLSLNGEDLTHLPLLTRKEKLKWILPSRSAHVFYVDHSRGNGTALYRLVCKLDLEGIVAKRAESRYEEDNPNVRNWIKIKNPAYSQKEGRGDLFRRAGLKLLVARLDLCRQFTNEPANLSMAASAR